MSSFAYSELPKPTPCSFPTKKYPAIRNCSNEDYQFGESCNSYTKMGNCECSPSLGTIVCPKGWECATTVNQGKVCKKNDKEVCIPLPHCPNNS